MNFDNIADLMKNAGKLQEKMQEQMKAHQDKLEQTTITGEAGAGAVTISGNAKYNVTKIKIDQHLKHEIDVLEELMVAAMNDYHNKVEKYNDENMSSAADMMGNFGDFFKTSDKN